MVSFEEALKLHLSLGQALAKLNGHHRGTTEGKRAAVNLCVYRESKRIAVVEDKLPRAGTGNTPTTTGVENQQN